MKELTFTDYHSLWDAWRRPYASLKGGFILFDTGEIMHSQEDMYVDGRQHYPELNVTICNSGEVTDHVQQPVYTPDNAKVAKAHILYNAAGVTRQQLLAIDHDKREIYLMKRSFKGDTHDDGQLPNVPEDISHRASIYWASAKSMPVCRPVRVVSPRKLTPAQAARGEETQVICQSVVSLKEIYRNPHAPAPALVFGKASSNVYATDMPLVDIVADMPNNVISYIAHNGVPSKKTEYVPYLKF